MGVEQDEELVHEVVVDDHVERDEESVCGYCGKDFSGNESRVEKVIYGRKWAFCDGECLENFMHKSNYTDEDPDMTTGEEDKTGFEIEMGFTGPQFEDDDV